MFDGILFFHHSSPSSPSTSSLAAVLDTAHQSVQAAPRVAAAAGSGGCPRHGTPGSLPHGWHLQESVSTARTRQCVGWTGFWLVVYLSSYAQGSKKQVMASACHVSTNDLETWYVRKEPVNPQNTVRRTPADTSQIVMHVISMFTLRLGLWGTPLTCQDSWVFGLRQVLSSQPGSWHLNCKFIMGLSQNEGKLRLQAVGH